MQGDPSTLTFPPESRVTVHKLDADGHEVWRYTGEVLQASPTHVRLRAAFNGKRVEVGGVVLEPGDTFVEDYYSDRWYNVYAIYSADGRAFRGWYCNISRPARIESGQISFEDLALDLIVHPDGRAIELDEDQFRELGLLPQEATLARQAVAELRELASAGRPPFVAQER
jgi:protein associated with RNAse G/E